MTLTTLLKNHLIPQTSLEKRERTPLVRFFLDNDETPLLLDSPLQNPLSTLLKVEDKLKKTITHLGRLIIKNA